MAVFGSFDFKKSVDFSFATIVHELEPKKNGYLVPAGERNII